jgi:REP element-mobilizing transposase RayT
VNGFVVMPNHVHALLSFSKGEKSINTIIGSGKRFMAYEIIKRLAGAGNKELLEKLGSSVEETRKKNNKLHDVWELSFDWKECRSRSSSGKN